MIRQANIKDLNGILEYNGKSNVQRKNWHIQAKKFLASYITNKHNFFFINIEKGKINGSISGELWDDKGFAYVGDISAKGKNKKEIIDDLFNHFVEFCKKKDITLINSYVRKSNVKRIATFKSLGMKKKGENFYFERRI